MTTPPIRPHRCGGCDERWSGAGVCHCAGCHRTFTGLASFDYHQAGDACRDPETVKKPMRQDGYGRWGWPETAGAVRGGVPRRAGSVRQGESGSTPVRDGDGPQIAAEPLVPAWVTQTMDAHAEAAHERLAKVQGLMHDGRVVTYEIAPDEGPRR